MFKLIPGSILVCLVGSDFCILYQARKRPRINCVIPIVSERVLGRVNKSSRAVIEKKPKFHCQSRRKKGIVYHWREIPTFDGEFIFPPES